MKCVECVMFRLARIWLCQFTKNIGKREEIPSGKQKFHQIEPVPDHKIRAILASFHPVFYLESHVCRSCFFFSSLKFPCGRREEKRTGKSQQWIHLWLNFFSFDLQVYFATFAFPGKRTWLRFGEIWETFFFLLSFNIFVVLNAFLARFSRSV